MASTIQMITTTGKKPIRPTARNWMSCGAVAGGAPPV